MSWHERSRVHEVPGEQWSYQHSTFQLGLDTDDSMLGSRAEDL
jgi:hypothetical protein